MMDGFVVGAGIAALAAYTLSVYAKQAQSRAEKLKHVTTLPIARLYAETYGSADHWHDNAPVS